MKTIEISNIHETPGTACERHGGWPLHLAVECGRLANLRPFTGRVQCSVCDQDWGGGVVSQHESCAIVRTDGSRVPARPVTYYLMAGEPAYVGPRDTQKEPSQPVEIRFT